MEIDKRASLNALEGTSSSVGRDIVDGEGLTPSSENSNNNNNNNNKDDIDIEELLARPRPRRGLFRRQKASLNKEISFLDAPEFVKRLSAFEEAKAGSTVSFSCQWQAFPKPAIKWYRDDEQLTEDNNRLSFEEGESGSLQLVINNCRKADEGAYKCKAENAEGVASTTGYLSVTGDIKEKVLSAQPRKNAQHAVSNPPRLKAIVEQKSLELREEEECNALPPSPIHDFVETFQKEKLSAKSKSPPLPVDGLRKEDDDEDSGSDTSVESQDFDRVPFFDPGVEDLDRELTPEPELFPEPEVAVDDVINGVQGSKVNVPTENNGVCYVPAGGTSQPIRNDFKYGEVPVCWESSSEVVRQAAAPAVIEEKEKPNGNHVGLTETEPHETETTTKFVSAFVFVKPMSAALSAGQVSAPLVQAQLSENGQPITKNTTTTDVAPEFPWLYTLGFSSFGTFVASATDMSPFWYVILLAVISLLSFRILLSTKSQCT